MSELYEISGWDIEGRPFVEICRVEAAGKLHRAFLHTAPCFGDVVVLRKAGPIATIHVPIPCRILQVDWRASAAQFELKFADCSSFEARAFASRKRNHLHEATVDRSKPVHRPG